MSWIGSLNPFLGRSLVLEAFERLFCDMVMLLQALHNSQSVIEVLADDTDQVVIPLDFFDKKGVEASFSIDLYPVLVFIFREGRWNLSLHS